MSETNPMKIAFVYDAVYPYVKGGVEKRIWELALRLTARGHEVHVFGMKYWEGSDHTEREGVHLHGVCHPHHLYTGGRRNISEAIWFSIRLIPHLLREDFDIIDCQQFPYFPCFSVKFVTILKRTPLVFTWIEVWGDYWYEYLGASGLIGKSMESWITRFKNPTIAISHFTARRLCATYPVKAEAVIPVGIDWAALQSISPAAEQTDVIFVGRLIREKNADLLVKATRILMNTNPEIRVIIVGEGPEHEKIASLIRENRLEAHVELHPFFQQYTDLVAQLKASHVCALPSVREGFGISALEALACGLPVVTVDHPANAICDLISDKNGFLSSLSADDLADKIREALMHHAEMREACIAAAAAYDWTRIAKECEEYYRSVIAKIRRPDQRRS
jgi:L-malate glycosyltransferase